MTFSVCIAAQRTTSWCDIMLC